MYGPRPQCKGKESDVSANPFGCSHVSGLFECRSKPEFPPFRGLMVRVLRQWFRWYDLAHHSSCAWRMTCKCSSWFPYRLACSHCARCPQTRKVHLGVPINPMGALIAATIRGSNARRALTAMTVAPVILGTAKQRIEGSDADNHPQDHAGADALIPPARQSVWHFQFFDQLTIV